MATTPEGLNARIGILGMARRYAKRKSEMAPIMDQREMMKAMAARYQVNKFQPPAAVAEGTNAAIPDPVSEVDLIKQRGSDVHAPGTSGGRIFQAVDYMTPNVVKKAYNTSLTGMAHELISGNKLFDLSAYDPSVIEDIASEVISFSMPLDAALMTVGGKAGAYVATKVGAPLIRKLVASGVKAEVAERIVGGAVGSVSSGTALGGYGATGAALQGGDAGEIVYAGLHSGALGLILGGTGAIAKPLEKFGMAGKAGQIGAEIGAFTVGGAGLEGRLPTTDDLSHAVGVVLGLKGMHKATGFVKSRLGEWILGKQMETKADLDIIMEELSKDPQEWEAFYKSLPGEAQKDLDQIRSDTYVPGGTVKLDAGEPLPETKPEVVNEKTEAIETKKTETQEVELDRPRDQPKVEAPKEQPAPLNTPLKDISFYQKHYPVGAKVNAANGIKGDIVGHDAETKLLQVKTESGDIVAVHPGDVKSLTRESAPPVSTTSTTNTTRPASNNDKKATYFTDRAAKLRQKAIDKTSGGVFDQNRTPRRERQRAHASEEAAQMNRIADVMEEFASRLQDGSLPKSLQGITTGTQLEALDYPWRQLYGQVDFEHQRRTRQQMMDWISMGSEDGKRLKKAGLNSKLEIMKAIDDYADLIKGETPEQAKKRELDKLESELVGTNAAGFFPTPKPVIDRMIEAADLQKSDKVLEPSAGKGDIVDAIKETGSENVDLAEINPMLRQILQLKGHGDNIDSDFTEMKSPGTYDKIVMNPPFEKGADVDHVRHAYNLLKPGGRIVSIMSEGSFFRSDKKATEFREWLDEVGTSEKLEPGSFKSAFRPTGVATRMVVIDKPGEITKETPPTTTGVPKTTDKTPVVSEGDKKPSHLQTSKEYKSERIPEELGRLERQIEDFRKQINIEEKELGENADNKNYFKNVAKAIIDSYEKEIEKLGDQKDYVQSDDYIDRSHPEEIAKALREGKEVPDNIKAQYPETKYQKPRNIQDVEVSLPSKGMKGVKDGLTAEVDKAIKSLEASEQVGIGIDMNASRIEPLRRELGLLESSLTDPTKNDVSKADSKKRIKELKEQISQFEESISRLPDQVRYKADGSTFVINNTLTDLRAFKDAIKATSATVYSSPAGKAPGKPPIRSGKSAKQNYYIEMPDTFVAPNEAGKSGTAYSVPIPLDPRPSGSLEQYKQQGTSGYATNGHYLIDRKRVKGVLKYVEESQGNPEASKVTELFEGKRGENSTPIEEIGRIKGEIAEDSKVIISLFYDPVGKKKYSFNAQYVDFMVKNVKDFRLEATTETGGAKIFSGNEYVGILMPLRTLSSVASARVIPFSTSGKPESIMRTEGMSFTENLRKVYEGDITGKGVGEKVSLENLDIALEGGDHIPLRNGWEVYLGQGGDRTGKFVVKGPKTREVVEETATGQKKLKFGLAYHPAGFYHIPKDGLKKFVKEIGIGTVVDPNFPEETSLGMTLAPIGKNPLGKDVALKSALEKALSSRDEKRKRLPTVMFSPEVNDVGIRKWYMTPTFILGAIPGMKAKFGKPAQAGMRAIIETEISMKIEQGSRDQFLDETIQLITKSDFGKIGERFVDIFEGKPVNDILARADISDGTKKAASRLRAFFDKDRTDRIETVRNQWRPGIDKKLVKAYRQENDIVGKKLSLLEKQNMYKELKPKIEAELDEIMPKDWGISDYFPHLHPGDYRVTAVMEDGSKEFVLGAKNKMDALAKIAEHYASENGEYKGVVDYQVNKKLFIDPDVTRVSRPKYHQIVKEIDKAAEVGESEIKAAMRGKIGQKETKQKHFFAFKKRRGYLGYSKDIREAVSTYSRGFVRAKHLTRLNNQFQPILRQVRGEGRKNTADYLETIFDHLWGFQSDVSRMVDAGLQKLPFIKDRITPMALDRWSSTVKTGLYYSLLQLNPRFHALNRMQTFQTLWPIVKTSEFLKGRSLYRSKEGKELLHKHGVRFMTGGKLAEVGAGSKRAEFRESMRGFAPETFNQEVAWTTMYGVARKQGYSDAEAARYAFLRGNVFSQFAFLQSDRPLLTRGPILSQVFMFKRFPIKNMELGYTLLREKKFNGFARWIGVHFLLGGAKAFIPDASLSAMGKGYLPYALYKQMKEEDETTANLIMFGLPSLLNMDLSYSVDMIDTPFGRNLGEKMFNMTGPLTNITYRTIQDATNTKGVIEDPLERAARSLARRLPAARSIKWLMDLDELMKGAETGEFDFRSATGKKQFTGDLTDIITDALGGRPVAKGELDLKIDAAADLIAQRDEVIDAMAMRWINTGEYPYDLEAEKMATWNTLWEDVWPITYKQVKARKKSREKSVEKTTEERILKGGAKDALESF